MYRLAQADIFFRIDATFRQSTLLHLTGKKIHLLSSMRELNWKPRPIEETLGDTAHYLQKIEAN